MACEFLISLVCCDRLNPVLFVANFIADSRVARQMDAVFSGSISSLIGLLSDLTSITLDNSGDTKGLTGSIPVCVNSFISPDIELLLVLDGNRQADSSSVAGDQRWADLWRDTKRTRALLATHISHSHWQFDFIWWCCSSTSYRGEHHVRSPVVICRISHSFRY